jgi:hypothetical protein
MSRHLGFQDASLINTMSSPFPQQKCTMLCQMLNKLISLHALLFRLETPLHNLRDLYTTPLSDYHELFGALITYASETSTSQRPGEADGPR